MTHEQPPTPPSQPLVPPHPAAPVPQQPAPQGWAQPAYGPPAGWAMVPTDSEAAKALRSARTALGWAIGAAVGAALALVGVLGLFVYEAGSMPMEGDYYAETLRGEVVGVSAGSRLGGDRLEYVVGGLLDEYDIDHDIECPDSDSVGVSSVVVCRGEVDGYEWTGVVVFEDDKGSFAVVEL